METTTKPMGKVNILYCTPCDRQLELGYRQIAYCPKCRACSRGTQAVATLCCLFCENVLAVTDENGPYCVHCQRIPSFQKTFFINEPD